MFGVDAYKIMSPTLQAIHLMTSHIMWWKRAATKSTSAGGDHAEASKEASTPGAPPTTTTAPSQKAPPPASVVRTKMLVELAGQGTWSLQDLVVRAELDFDAFSRHVARCSAGRALMPNRGAHDIR